MPVLTYREDCKPTPEPEPVKKTTKKETAPVPTEEPRTEEGE